MDKKTILGLVAMALVFIGFAYLNGKEQQRYQAELDAYHAYQDSVRRATMPEVDSTTYEAVATEMTTTAAEQALAAADVAHAREVEMFGQELTEAAEAEAAELVVENEVMTVRFTTRGAQIAGVTLKEYTKYGPKEHRTEPVEMFDSAAERFNLSFFVRRGLHDVKVSTADYTFVAEPVATNAEGAQVVTMRLAVAPGASLVYEYLIYNTKSAERDYLIDFRV
ncbi:MAG: YidC/Oxa1 family insertase periplasmic-domain containing protein, partial [Alistipes sp.]|nr:YidC/Oxa1 family insertase periplasmic-domain containing protein [Alistipes sp.]